MKKGTSRNELLNKDLTTYNPKMWKINIPFINYSVRIEDFVPALSGSIGKTSLIAAFVMSWAVSFGITDYHNFVTENVRLELIVGSILTILLCAVLNPYASPPGTLAPLIPIIPMMAASGVHPLPLGLIIGILGLFISAFRYFDKITIINGVGAKGGIILLFGLLGIQSSLNDLKLWSEANNLSILLVVLILVGIIQYIILTRLNVKWLIIPVCAIFALVFSALFGVVPNISTPVSLPIINPNVWWNEKWGIGWGISVENFIKALPFGLLAVVMWPTDALAIRALQESSYPKEAHNTIFKANSSFIIASIRNIIGVVLGGGQTSAIWRSFMIPLSSVKRPIGGSAFLLGIIGLFFGISGFLLDIAVFPPLIALVLIFGVFVPLLEVGLNTIRSVAKAQIAILCILLGMVINPVIGWVVAILVENFNILGKSEEEKDIKKLVEIKITTTVVVFVTVVSFVLANILS
ncbi:UNVERIFIED_CONTAM: 6Fe-6S prismane cluster-containing protein [Acetivibrio alkalicellulosi]